MGTIDMIRKKASGFLPGTISVNVLKWAVFAVGFIVLLVTLAGGRVSDKPFEEVKSQVVEVADTDSMKEADNRMVKRLYGIDPALYEAVTLYYPVSNMGAEELFMVRVKDDSQSDAVMEAINKRLEAQKRSFDGYGTDQTAILESSVIKKSGHDIIFVAAKDAPDVVRVFESAL